MTETAERIEFPRWKRVLSHLPIFKGLLDTTAEAHEEAAKEAIVSVLFATAPIWLPAFALLLYSGKSLSYTIDSLLGQGELFMYSTAALAPIFFLVFKNFGEISKSAVQGPVKAFPSAMEHVVIVVVIAMICSFSYAYSRSELPALQKNAVFWTSVAMYAASTGLIYLATVYDKSRPIGYEQTLRAEERDLTEQLEERHP